MEAYEAFLLRFPNVVGVATGPRKAGPSGHVETCIRVYVERKPPLEALGRGEVLPRWLEGYPVVVEEVGAIEARDHGAPLGGPGDHRPP
jgi:hypothetical protein